MLHSSDEEIIIRKTKTQKKRNLENLFDSEEQSEEMSMMEEEYSDQIEYNNPISSKLMTEIFGTGKEYFYVLAKQPETQEIIKEAEKKAPTRKLTEELLSFLIDNLEEMTYSIVKEAAELILDGACVEFLVLGRPELKLNVEIGYKINDLIELYFNNPSLITKLKNANKLNLKYANLIVKKKKDFFEESNYFVKDDTNLYKFLTKNNLIINKNKFRENLLEKERIHAPEDIEEEEPLVYIRKNFFGENPVTKFQIIDYISNEYLKDVLLKDAILSSIMRVAYLEIKENSFLITDLEKNSFYETISEIRNDNYQIIFDSVSILNNFFINNNFNSKWNEFRKEIIYNFIKQFNIENHLRDRLKNKFKEIGKRALTNNILDRVINGRVQFNNFFIGVTIEKIHFKVSVVDYDGNLREFVLVNFNDRHILGELMQRFQVKELFVSGETQKVKGMIKNLEYNMKYVESNLVKRYSNSRDFTQNIVRMVVSPETELAYMINNNFDLVSAILDPLIPNNKLLLEETDENSFGERNDLFFALFLTVKEQEEVLKRALQSALSIVGVDINTLLTDRRKQNLINFMPGFYISEKLKEYKFIERISLIEGWTEKDPKFDFRNAAVFLRVNSNYVDILDTFPIHPFLYKQARVLCAAAIERNETDEINISSEVKIYLENKASASFDLQKVAHIKDLYDKFVFILGVLNEKQSFFDGCPDKIVFQDLIGEFKYGIYEGNIVEVKKGFAIISVSDKFSVFVTKNFDDSFYYNQLVKVKLTGKNVNFLSYSGELIKETKKEISNLEINEERFFIRKSKTSDFYYLTIRLEENLFYAIKFELVDNKIFLHEKYFDDVEELKFKFIRQVFVQLKHIKSHPKYFGTKEEAESYVRNRKDKILYAFYLSNEYPGRVVFVFYDGKLHNEFIKISDKLIFNSKVFSNLDEFLHYRKNI